MILHFRRLLSEKGRKAVGIQSGKDLSGGFMRVSSGYENLMGQWKGSSDRDIWKAFRAGSKSALIYIYTLYFQELFSYALQFHADRESVKDNIQDLFVYLHKHRKTLGETNNIKFYLFKSLRRRIKSTVDKRKWLTSENNNLNEIEQNIEDNLIEQENQVQSKKLLNNAIRKLPEKQKEIIYYYYYQNFSYAQIAEIMNFSQVKSARKLLYRALQSLRQTVNLRSLFEISMLTLIL